MKPFNLLRKRNGEQKSEVVSVFVGEKIDDPEMLNDVQHYIDAWIESYTSITNEEKQELFADFDGNLSYDVWSFELVEE